MCVLLFYAYEALMRAECQVQLLTQDDGAHIFQNATRTLLCIMLKKNRHIHAIIVVGRGCERRYMSGQEMIRVQHGRAENQSSQPGQTRRKGMSTLRDRASGVHKNKRRLSHSCIFKNV